MDSRKTIFYILVIFFIHFLGTAEENTTQEGIVLPPFLDSGATRVGAIPLPSDNTELSNRSSTHIKEKSDFEAEPSPRQVILPPPLRTISDPPMENPIIPVSSSLPIETKPKNTFENTSFLKKMTFLNGVNIEGIKNETFENVNVKIDSKGNIYIESSQYEVSREELFHPLLPEEYPKYSKEYTKAK